MKTPFLSRNFAALLLTCALALAGCNKKDEAPKAPAAGEPSTAPVKSAVDNSYDEVAAQLDPGGSFYLYLSTEQWLANLGTSIDTMRQAIVTPSLPDEQREQAERAFKIMQDLVQRSGLQDVTGLGASSIALDPGLHRNKVFVHHHAGKGDGFLWNAFGKAPHALDPLAFLPSDTALASFSDVDIKLLVQFVRDEIAASKSPEAQQALDQAMLKFSMMAGMTIDEALASLGGAAGVVITLDPAKPMAIPMPAAGGKNTIPTPRLALFFKTNDDRIFKKIDEGMGQIPNVEKVDEAEVNMRTMSLPLSPEMVVRPTAAQWGGWLIIATDDQLVRDLIAAKTSGKGFTATPEFQKLSGGLPSEGNGFQLVTELFAKTMMDFQKGVMQEGSMPPEQAAIMEKLMSFQKPGAAYAVWTRRPDGWLSVGKSAKGAEQFLVPLVVAPVAIAAGMALPVFSKVQDKGKATKSLSNAKQIGLACKLWALDNDGAFPPSLEVLVPDYIPTTQVFISPFNSTMPMGYTYHAGLTENSPPETVLIEDTFAPGAGQNVVVHVDISGEVTTL